MSLRLPFFVANVDLDKYISVTLPYLALASLNLLQLWAICWQHQSISIEPKNHRNFDRSIQYGDTGY